ncbi:unnamed protein product [Lampetra planeri]
MGGEGGEGLGGEPGHPQAADDRGGPLLRRPSRRGAWFGGAGVALPGAAVSPAPARAAAPSGLTWGAVGDKGTQGTEPPAGRRVAQVLFDFTAEAEGELTVNEGDILTIVAQGSGTGWIEVENAENKRGIVPENYLRIQDTTSLKAFTFSERDADHTTRFEFDPRSMAAPLSHTRRIKSKGQVLTYYQLLYHFSLLEGLPPLPENPGSAIVDTAAPSQPPTGSPSRPIAPAADSDSWEDSDGEGAKAGSQRGVPQGSPRQGRANAASTLLGLNRCKSPTGIGTSHSPPPPANSLPLAALLPGNSEVHAFFPNAPIRLALPMGKLNLDNYLLGKCTVTRTDRIPLVMGESGPVWETSSDNLVCVISSPKKSTKLHGMKSFIEYQITPNDSLKPVSRRYKHFDWLLERLISKFSAMVLIPSLPDKQVAGRFEDDFVALRMERLQAWMSRICLHPILSSSSVFQHFLHAATEKEWKEGKRRAEKDDAVGGAIFSKLEMFNAVEFHADEMEKRVDNFGKFFRSADDSVKQLLAVGNVHYRRCTTELPKDYRGLGKALKDVSQSFSMSNHHAEGSLTNALSFAGKTYTEIGDLVASQSKMDLRLFLDSSCEYKSLLSGFPEILSIQKAGLDKIKECDRLIQINKMAAGEKDGVVQRVHVMSLGLQAEVNNFHESRIRDYKESVRQLLYNQIQLHQKIAEMMREAYMRFEFESQ